MKHVWIRVKEMTGRRFSIEFRITPKFTFGNDEIEVTHNFGIFFGIALFTKKEFRITISKDINHPDTD